MHTESSTEWRPSIRTRVDREVAGRRQVEQPKCVPTFQERPKVSAIRIRVRKGKQVVGIALAIALRRVYAHPLVQNVTRSAEKALRLRMEQPHDIPDRHGLLFCVL